MPNYSHNTKLTMATSEEPPYLAVGTDVSAKYKGAFCEAKIIEVFKNVKVRVLFEGSTGTYLIDDADLKPSGSPLETGTKVEAKHPEKKQQTYVQATITKILDHSRYMVVFDDGDQCLLRRNSLCLKSGKHFAESETLDQLPLTNPEHFGNPVKVGANDHANTGNSNSNSSSNHHNSKSHATSHQALNDKPAAATTKGNKASATTLTSTNSATNSNSTTATTNASPTSNSTTTTTTTTNATTATSTNTATSTTTNNSTGNTGRRGAAKGRKRRESVNNGPKKEPDFKDDDSIESSADSADANQSEDSIKYDAIEVGVKLMVQYGKGKIQNVYEAKVNKIETNPSGKTRYFVHYTGWNNRYDEWIPKGRILNIVTDKENVSNGRSRQQQKLDISSSPGPNATTAANVSANTPATTTPAATASNVTSSTTAPSSSNSSTRERETIKHEKETPAKTRRSRLTESASTVSASPQVSSMPAKPDEETTTMTTTGPRDKSRGSNSMDTNAEGNNAINNNSNSTPITRERDKTSNKYDKEPPTKTRRSRLNEQASSISTVTNSSNAMSKIEEERETKVTNSRVAVSASSKDSGNGVHKSNGEATAAPVQMNSVSNTSSAPTATSSAPSGKERDSIKHEKEPPAKTRRSRLTDSASTPTVTASAQVSSTPAKSEEEKESMTSSTRDKSRASSSVEGNTDVAGSTNNNGNSTPITCDRDKPNNKHDKEPPTKTRRSRLTEQVSVTSSTQNAAISGNVMPKIEEEREIKATVNNKIGSTANTSTVSVASGVTTSVGTASVAASTTTTAATSAPTPRSPISKSVYRFCDEIEESDCDKKISILQERMMALRQTYMSLKSELADLDRRRKRPRTERSNSEHINNCSLTCRN